MATEQRNSVWSLVVPAWLWRWLKTLIGAAVAAATLVSAAFAFAVQFGWDVVGRFGFWLIVLLIVGFGLGLIWRLWAVANMLRGELLAADARLAEQEAQHAAGLQEMRNVVVGGLGSLNEMWSKSFQDQSTQLQSVLETAKDNADTVVRLTERIGQVAEKVKSLSGQ